ncbi:glycosyltransferase family 4 protein [bacterium]|nr:glycosyltransferase family 4 protein [bacterium]
MRRYFDTKKMHNPKILILVEDRHFPPSKQAAASRIGAFAKYWSRRSQVVVVTHQISVFESEYFRFSFPLAKKRWDFLKLPWILPRLLKLARQIKPDIIFVSFPFIWQAVEGCYLMKRLGCPLILDIRDLPEAVLPLNKIPILHYFMNLLQRVLALIVIPKVSSISTVTEWLKKEIQEKFKYDPKRIFVIRNGSEASNSNKSSKREKKFDLVYSGMLASDARNPRGIIDYIYEMVKIFPLLRVRVISDLETRQGREFLEGLKLRGLTKNFEFEEMVPPKELTGRLRSAKLGLNSLAYGLLAHKGAVGAKEYDYLMAGLPVVCLMDPSLYVESRGLILGNGVGIMDPDPEKLAEKTVRLLNDEKRLREMSEKARRLGRRFDRKKLADDFYRDVILTTIERHYMHQAL